MKKPMTKNILIVEDNSISRRMLEHMLNSQGSEFTVTTASDGQEAWTILQDPKNRFDACITDLVMPNMGGIELISKIKAHSRLCDLPVIVCTAITDRGSMSEVAELDIDLCFEKPFKKNEVIFGLRRLWDVLDRSVVAEKESDWEDFSRELFEKLFAWINQAKASFNLVPPAFVIRGNGFMGACLMLKYPSLAKQIAVIDDLFVARAHKIVDQELILNKLNSLELELKNMNQLVFQS